MEKRTPIQDAEHFIQNETQFHLGFLVTEQSHPRTRGLSQTLSRNTRDGIRMLLSVDDDLPPVIAQTLKSNEFKKLVDDMKFTLCHGGRIHFTGCGATGRLSILLDSANRRFWREKAEQYPEIADLAKQLQDQTNAVMTGGDYALIRSVESFEDFISFGYRQMKDAGVTADDLIVAISEGGETSSVIGTIHAGLDVGARVSFLFNNPSDLMSEHVERSRVVIQDERVNVVNLTTGPMSVAGSTRMQATTIELIIAGTAFEFALADIIKNDTDSSLLQKLGLDSYSPQKIADQFDVLLAQLRTEENVETMAEYTDFEAEIYANRGKITYFSDGYLLDIFTDTTERAPTFKTPPFHSVHDKAAPDPWAYVKDPMRPSKDTWIHVLEHEPRCLNWLAEDYRAMKATEKIIDDPPQIGRELLYTFQIGNEPDPSRTNVLPNAAVSIAIGNEIKNLDSDNIWNKEFLRQSCDFAVRKIMVIGPQSPEISTTTDDLFYIKVDLPRTPLDLFGHLAVKLVLNNVSTASMGKIGRLNSNWMAHVEASNKKLIDRSVRLISELANVDYRTACITLYETIKEMEDWPEERRKIVSPAAYAVEKIGNNIEKSNT